MFMRLATAGIPVQGYSQCPHPWTHLRHVLFLDGGNLHGAGTAHDRSLEESDALKGTVAVTATAAIGEAEATDGVIQSNPASQGVARHEVVAPCSLVQ